jgi:hypothetical protein
VPRTALPNPKTRHEEEEEEREEIETGERGGTGGKETQSNVRLSRSWNPGPESQISKSWNPRSESVRALLIGWNN